MCTSSIYFTLTFAITYCLTKLSSFNLFVHQFVWKYCSQFEHCKKILAAQLPAHTFKNLPFWFFYYTPMRMQINIVAHSRDRNMHILIRFFRYPFILARVPIIQIVFYELGVFFFVAVVVFCFFFFCRFDFAAGYDYLFYVVGYLIFANTQLDQFSELFVFLFFVIHRVGHVKF